MDNTDNKTNPTVEDAEIVATNETQMAEAQDVEDGEVTDVETDPNVEPQEDGMSIIRLEELIRQHLTDIERDSTDLKEKKAMYDDTFLNDTTYREAEQKAEAAMKEKEAVKDRIQQMASMVDLKNGIALLREQMKETKVSLSDHLREYQRLTQANQIEVSEGDTRDIVTTARLVKKNSKYRP